MKFHSSLQPLGQMSRWGGAGRRGEEACDWTWGRGVTPGTLGLTPPLCFPSKPRRRSFSSCAASAARKKPRALSYCFAYTHYAQDAWRPRACSALSARLISPSELVGRPWIMSSSRVCSGACQCTGRSWMHRPFVPAAKRRRTSGASNVSSSSVPSALRHTSGSSSTRLGPWLIFAVSQCASSWMAHASPTTSSAPTPTTAALCLLGEPAAWPGWGGASKSWVEGEWGAEIQNHKAENVGQGASRVFQLQVWSTNKQHLWQ